MVSQNDNMKTPEIKKVEFMRGIIGTNPILDDPRPQVAFVGRSNVGKSSTLNVLVNQKIARASKTPGKTQEVNFFLVNDQVYFVDLPGYGYAQISAHSAEKLRKHIIWYLTESGVTPKYVVLIIDAKVGFTDLDRDMLDILREEEHRVLILVNKIDKLNQKEAHAQMKKIEEEVAFRALDYTLLTFSAHTKKGRDAVLKLLFS